MADLFASDQTGAIGALPAVGPDIPLAERLRPASIEQVIGQEHVTGPDALLTRMIASGRLSSLILWGPPGSGKTSIARLLADAVGYDYASVSAIFCGVSDLKSLFAQARDLRRMGRQMLLFVDEIHRFNRAQLDAFLPVMEDGTIILVGATTQNPSFEINAALLSRAQLLILKPLDEAALSVLLDRALQTLPVPLVLEDAARDLLIDRASGDGRHLINQIELLLAASSEPAVPLDAATVARLVSQRPPAYDKDRDGHFNLISALHKAMRGSDPDAALYYLARMLTAGEDPLYVLRRIVRFASEDIGLADPNALVQATAAVAAFQLIGSPDGELAIAQACLYCATAPKSNAAYMADKAARDTARRTSSSPPPLTILNAPTRLMQDAGYGTGYVYDHDQPDAFSGQNYWPDDLGRQSFYQPTDRGFEKRLADRLAWWEQVRAERNAGLR